MGKTSCIHGDGPDTCVRCALQGVDLPPIHVALILDVSPSMSGGWKTTLSSLNEYIASLRNNQDSKFRVTLTTFSQQVGILYDDVDPDALPKFDSRNLSPIGQGTALYDAVGQTVEKIKTSDPVLVVVITDGEENSSHDWNADKVEVLTKEREKQGNYTFVYLGAAREAWGKGVQIAAHAANTLNTGDTHAAFTNLTAATAHYVGTRSFQASALHKSGGNVGSMAYSSSNFFETPDNSKTAPEFQATNSKKTTKNTPSGAK
jgi:hypothetical protein